VKMGDVQRDPDKQAPAPPPTLTAPGEKLPANAGQNQPGAMKPVQFPKQKPDDYPDATNLPRDHNAADTPDTPAKPVTQPAPPAGSTPAPAATPAPQPGQSPSQN
jgi:hypothetical protein